MTGRPGTPLEWAWDDLQTAAEAMEAVGKTNSPSLTRSALLLLRRRAAAHLAALDKHLEDIGE
jgi:hypothetical protein